MHKVRIAAAAACLSVGTALLGFATPASAASPRIEVCTYSFNANGVNIRANHNTGATILGQGQRGQGFTSAPFTTGTGSGFTWIKGTDGNTGIAGWVASQFLTLNGCHNFT
jgi:hypothetical protein